MSAHTWLETDRRRTPKGELIIEQCEGCHSICARLDGDETDWRAHLPPCAVESLVKLARG